MKQKAVGYIRVSDKSQINGDGFPRQIKAITDYAQANNLEIIKIYREKGVSGTLRDRPALTEMLLSFEDNPDVIETIVIERVDRLARDLMIQENLLHDLGKHGVSVISTTDGDLLDDDPTRKLVRQVLGAIAEYDKTMLVLKLQAARDRKRKETGKCEGQKGYLETHPELIDRIKKLRRKPRGGKRLSLKKTLKALQDEGWKTSQGQEFNMSALKNIVYITLK